MAVTLSSVLAAAACSNSSETPPPRSAQMEQASPESVTSEQARRTPPRANEPTPGSMQTPLPDHPTPGPADGTPPNSWSSPIGPGIGGGPPPAPPDKVAPDNGGRDMNEGAYSSHHPDGDDADAMLADRIRASLKQDDKLSDAAKNVDISIADGKVTLRGTVKTRAEKKSVESKARNIAGAAEVESRLEVKK
jgi:hypothetical protein